MATPDFSSEIGQLKSVLDELEDRAMHALQDFMASGNDMERQLEKRVHRARHAIAKAIKELDSSASETSE